MSTPSLAGAACALALSLLVPRAASSAVAGAPTLPPPSGAQAVLPVRARVHIEIPLQSLSTYAHVAHDVVWARVAGLRVEPWRDLALTVVTLDVLGSVKDRVAGRVEVGVLGGELPGGRVVVDEAPAFAPGEELVLFLSAQPSTGALSVLGLRQGTYRVQVHGGELAVEGLHARGERLLDFLDRTTELAATPRVR